MNTVDFCPIAAISSAGRVCHRRLVETLIPCAARKICATSPRIAKFTFCGTFPEPRFVVTDLGTGVTSPSFDVGMNSMIGDWENDLNRNQT
jgi:hypothetical protein